MFLKTLCTGAALGLCLTGAAMAGDEPAAKTLAVGDQAPAIDIAHWIKGVEVTDRGYGFEPMTEFEEGKVYVLEFWATWCGPCKASMPHLSKLQEKYRDYDVTVIGVSDEPLPTVIKFLFTTWKEDGKIQNDRTHYVLTTDPDKSVKTDYFTAAGRRGIPSAFIIGKDSHVEWIGHPMDMDDPLDAVVRDSWDRDAFKKKYEREQRTEKKLAAAYKEKDWDTVLGVLDESLAEDPENTGLMMRKCTILLTEVNRPEEAYALGHALLEANWDNAGMLNGIAWMVVDDPRVTKRDFDFALKAANRANELTKSTDAAVLDTLARVYYEKGDLKKAIKWQKKAVENAGEGRMGEDIRKVLEKYESEAK